MNVPKRNEFVSDCTVGRTKGGEGGKRKSQENLENLVCVCSPA